MRPTRLWPLFLASGLGLALLLGLGIWQMERLAEKRAFIQQIEVHLAAEPSSLESVLDKAQTGQAVDLVKTEVQGYFIGPSQFMQASYEGGGAFRLITPFRTDSGVGVLVDRGMIPADARVAFEINPQGPQHLIGLLRRHQATQGLFDPDNDAVRGNWYWWDMPALLAAAKFPPDLAVAPYVLQLLPQKGDTGLPIAEPPMAGIANNHLQYAITWFSLAACLVVMTGLLARRLKTTSRDGALRRAGLSDR